MRGDAVEVVGPEGAAAAADLPVRTVHEVVDDELAALAEEIREQVELLLPVLAVAVHPDGRVEQGARVQAAPADASGALLLDEPRPHQYLDVTGHGLK